MVGKQQQEKMLDFSREYASQLREMEEALDASLVEVWDPLGDPVELITEPYESASLVDLVKTDNKLFGKIILVFSSLCLEMKKLSVVGKQQFYAPFLMFGKELEEPTLSEGDTQVKIGRMLSFLKEFSDYISRSWEVIRNVMRQLASLFIESNELFKTSFKNVHLEVVFDHIGQLLAALTMLDEVCKQNKMLQQAWAMYKRMTKAMKGDSGRYSTSDDEILKFEKFLLNIEGKIFEGQIYATAVQQEFDYDKLVIVKKNKDFRGELYRHLKMSLAELRPEAGRKMPSKLSTEYVKVCALYGLYFNIYQDVADKKLFKEVWDYQSLYPIVHVSGNVTWSPTEFLSRKVQYMTKTIIGNKFNPTAAGQDFTKRMDAEFDSNVVNSYREVSVWMSRMESSLGNRADLRLTLETRVTLLLDGLALANEISYNFKSFALMHLHYRVPVKPSHVLRLCQCVEQLKAIQHTFFRRSAMVGESMGYMIQQIQFYLQSRFLPLKVKMEDNKKLSSANLDALAALTILLQMLNGPATHQRRIVMQLCMQRVYAAGFLKAAEIQATEFNMAKLITLSNVKMSLNDACNCSFMYWNTEMLPLYFKHIYNNPLRAPTLQYMFSALNDVEPFFSKAVYVDADVLRDILIKKVMGILTDNVIKPLREKIEIDLRLQIHSHLKVSERDPFKNGSSDLSTFLRISPLRLFHEFVDIRQNITNYLDTTFYNLTTVALYDWKTYAEMRNLAKEKYGLQLTEVHLPGQTLEQGLDVLEIMRNIHVFVARFNYNLNNQIFIEKMSESKSLHTINIQHIANSIRTHGAGIMNTTVNFTYQFLRRKFFIFSQFLYDDHIKSRLIKDCRYFREKKAEISSQYPYDRADRFNKEIRRLGVTQQGYTYLDQFRILITEIGNAMGYVRLIRSGGLRYVSNSIKFVPDLQGIQKFVEMVKEGDLSKETEAAAANLDEIIANLMKNFAEGSDYNRMLVKVFAKEFRNPSLMHLSTFYGIIPPLTINYVEHILGLKDQLAKEAKRGGKNPGSFTDDGFAIGLVYILKLLDQYTEFDSLHWFQGTMQKFYKEIADLQAQSEANQKKKGKKSNPDDDGALQSVAMTIRRNQRYLKEFEMLRFSFSGARIFFRFEDDDAVEVKETPSPAAAEGQQASGEASGSGGAPPPPQGEGGPPPPPPPPPPPL